MVWATGFTEMLGVRYPIVSAPMGGSAGGALAAAVSSAGGFGMLGGGTGRPEWLEPELEILAGRTSEPWGVGLLSWAADPGAVAGRESELTGDPQVREQARQAYREAVARGDAPPQPVWAGEAADLITDLPPAAEVVAAMVREAELAFSRVTG